MTSTSRSLLVACPGPPSTAPERYTSVKIHSRIFATIRVLKIWGIVYLCIGVYFKQTKGKKICFVYKQWRRNEFESGGTGPERKWGTDAARSAGKKFFLVVPLHVLALKAQLVVL